MWHTFIRAALILAHIVCDACSLSLVRGAIMRVIFASAAGADGVDQERVQAPNVEHEIQDQQVSDAASACMLWCSVAIGALVEGHPPERVSCFFVMFLWYKFKFAYCLRHRW